MSTGESEGALEAWLTPRASGVEAAFRAAGTGRAPVTRVFSSETEAIAWVAREAEAVDAPLLWRYYSKPLT